MSRWHNIYVDNFAYFFTATVVEYVPALNSISIKDFMIHSLNFYREEYDTKINAYVIMPEHIHLIIRSELGENVKKFIQHFLRKVSRMVITDTQFSLTDEYSSTGAEERLNVFRSHARGKAIHRVWKERAKGEPISSDKVMKQKLDYIHMNPVKRGLVKNPEDYPYSSYRNYYLKDHSIIQIDSVDVLIL
jgi:putative transposase